MRPIDKYKRGSIKGMVLPLGVFFSGLIYAVTRRRKGKAAIIVKPWAREVAEACYAEALLIIEDVGVHEIKRETSLRLYFRPPEMVVNGYAAYKSTCWDIWVCAETGNEGKFVMMAVDGIGKGEAIHRGILVHEIVHHLLLINGHGWQHHKCYDGKVFGWAGARHVIGKNKRMEAVS